MQLKTRKKLLGILTVAFLLLGFLVACSNSADEPNEINENQNELENNSSNHLVDNENPMGDLISENPPNVNDADTNANENSSADDEERPNEAEVESDGGSDSRIEEPLEEPLEVENDNQTTPTNTRDERPTLRSPVDSADDPRALTIGVLHFQSNRQHESFREHYTRMFEWDHPQVDIEFVVATEEENHLQ